MLRELEMYPKTKSNKNQLSTLMHLKSGNLTYVFILNLTFQKFGKAFVTQINIEKSLKLENIIFVYC